MKYLGINVLNVWAACGTLKALMKEIKLQVGKEQS